MRVEGFNGQLTHRAGFRRAGFGRFRDGVAGRQLGEMGCQHLACRSFIDGTGEDEDGVRGFVILLPVRTDVIERDGANVFGKAALASASRRGPDLLASDVHGTQSGDLAEHVGDLDEQARFLTIEVGGGDAEVAHASRCVGQLLLKVRLRENGGDDRVEIAGLCVAAGAVALEERLGSAHGFGAGRGGDVEMLHQVAETRSALWVVIAADPVEQEERHVARPGDGPERHCQAVVENEMPWSRRFGRLRCAADFELAEDLPLAEHGEREFHERMMEECGAGGLVVGVACAGVAS